jgi:hypothetical protein
VHGAAQAGDAELVCHAGILMIQHQVGPACRQR